MPLYNPISNSDLIEEGDDNLFHTPDRVNTLIEAKIINNTTTGGATSLASAETVKGLKAEIDDKISMDDLSEDIGDDLVWELYGIGADGADYGTTPYRIRCAKVFIKAGSIISLQDNTLTQFMVYSYNHSTGTFIEQLITSWTTNEPFEVPYDADYRMQARKPDNTNYTEGEILSAASNFIVNVIGNAVIIGGIISDGAVTPAKLSSDLSQFVNISNSILSKKTAVSDMFSFTSGSAPHMVIDEDKGVVYVSYLTARTGYGEQRTITALSVFPIMQPQRALHYIVAEEGVAIEGTTFTRPYEPNIIMMTDRVRIFFLPETYSADSDYNDSYFYRDFMKVAKTLGTPTPVAFKETSEGESKILNKTNIDTYLTGKGFTPGTGHPIVCTTRFIKSGELHYGALTSLNQNPVIFSTADSGATLILKGVVPTLSDYECQLDIDDANVMYLINRGHFPNFYTSADYGETFSTGQTFTISDVRPQLIKYKGKILIVHSEVTSETGLKVLDGRQNAIFKYGTTLTAASYVEMLRLTSIYGMVYYAIYNYKDDIYMVFSNGEMYSDKGTAGKDGLYFVKVGAFFDGLPYEIQA